MSPRIIIARGVLAAVLLAASLIAVALAADTPPHGFIALAAIALYCAAGYWLTPRPNYDDVGYAGGLIDNPFRISDDYNRMLIAVAVVLWPGRFVTRSLRDLVRHKRGVRIMVLPPRD